MCIPIDRSRFQRRSTRLASRRSLSETSQSSRLNRTCLSSPDPGLEFLDSGHALHDVVKISGKGESSHPKPIFALGHEFVWPDVSWQARHRALQADLSNRRDLARAEIAKASVWIAEHGNRLGDFLIKTLPRG